MSQPKQHHYLPQFYLEFFCQDGGFWVYDISSGTYRSGTPFNTGKRHYYNALVAREGTRDYSIEKALSEIEDKAAPIVREKVEKRLPITSEEKETLALFIGVSPDGVRFKQL
jgi:hypothetical protein